MDSNILSNENLEELTIIWLDSQAYSIDIKIRLRCIINFLKIFDNVDDCFNYISSIKTEQVFLITSGLLSEAIVSLVHDLPQLRFIYIFCENKEKYELWSKSYLKIHGIFSDQETLYVMLTRDVKICSNTTSISFFNTNEKSLSNLNGTFYWYQLLRKTLLHMPQTNIAKQELIDIGRKHYVDNDRELLIIDDFNKNYQTDEAIRWYTRDSYLYRLLNKALRTENIDLIFKFRFFIIDLHNQLQILYKDYIELLRSYDLDYLTVYRGQQMTTEEFQKLRDNIGGLISINSFLSTTTDSSIAMIYAGSDIFHPQLVCVLFHMTIDLNLINADSERPFASIREYSYFKHEDEILFSMSTIFRIESIERTSDNNVWNVKLTFIHEDDAPIQELYDHFNIRHNQHATEADLGYLLLIMGDYDRAIHYCKLLLTESHEFSLLNIDVIVHCYYIIGEAYSDKLCYELALQYYETGLETQLKYDPSNTTLISVAYNNIGLVHRQLGSNCSLIREYYEKALQLQLESSEANYTLIATIQNNMAPLMDTVEESIEYYLKAIEIRKAYLPLAHPLIATTYSCLGQAYSVKGDTVAALKCFEYVIDSREKYLPKHHPSHLDSYSNLGSLYITLGDENKIRHLNDQLAKDYFLLSLKYYSKALDTASYCFCEKNQEKISRTHSNISVTYIRLEEYEKAFEHLMKAKENQSNEDAGVWHNNMGKVYTKRRSFETGLAHYNEALLIYQETIKMDNPLFARLYYNLGELYEMKNDYVNALINYEKALDTASSNMPKNNIYVDEYKNAVQGIRNIMANN